MDEWAGVSDDGDKKALLIHHQLNKHLSSQSEAREQDRCHIQIDRKKGSFKVKKKTTTKNQLESTGHFWSYPILGVPGDFHQQQNEKIRLSKPAPLPTEPPQARLLRENRC